MMGVVTFYSYYLMSKVLELCENQGRRHIRFRELASDVLGNVVVNSPLVYISFFFSYSWEFVLLV